MAYYNLVSNEWVCEDKCPDKSKNMICGETKHLTSFALLLGGKASSCDSSDETIFAWLSLAFVGFAIVICVIVAIGFEINLAIRRKNQKNEFLEIQTRIETAK